MDDIRRDTLSPGPAVLIPPYSSPLGHPHVSLSRRRRQSISHTSVASSAPSLTQTVLSLFQATDDEDEDTPVEVRTNDFQSRGERAQLLDSARDVIRSGYDCDSATIHGATLEHTRQIPQHFERRRNHGILTLVAWKWYFRPLVRSAYYKPLFHLLALNFPYALVAWLYLFIFTVVS